MTYPIYLDYNATTPVDRQVLDDMTPWFTEQFWNAASSHSGGRIAAENVDASRRKVAAFIGARPNELVWTSGATESNNLALKGVVAYAKPNRKRLVTFATEHKAVLDTVASLENQNIPVTVLSVEPDGTQCLDELTAALADGDVAVVSVMAANNETGLVADIATIAALTHQHGALLHCDATQAAGKIGFNVEQLDVDLASISAHKIYGPKGIGALYVSRRIDIAPMIHGGGHERGMRSGTLNVAAIVGFATATEIASNTLETQTRHQHNLIELFIATLDREISDFSLTTGNAPRLPNTANIRIDGADAEAVMANTPGVAISSGSACTALVPAPSHVLTAMGLSDDRASECIRISAGRPTTESDIINAAQQIATAVQRVRNLTK